MTSIPAETLIRTRGRVARSALRMVLLASLTLLAIGCTPFRGLRDNLQYNDGMNDFVLGWRNSVWARQAWESRKREHLDEPQFHAFGQGFRDGYADVAGGANGCVPALPPRSYWTWKYQTGEGQAKVAAWFAGYPYGARAAAEDGAGNFQQIQVSHLIEQQYSPEFQAGLCPGCDPALIPGYPAPGQMVPGMEVIPPGSAIPFDPALPAVPGTVVPSVPTPGVPGPTVPLPAAPGAPLPLENPTSLRAIPHHWPEAGMTRTPALPAPQSLNPVVPASAVLPLR